MPEPEGRLYHTFNPDARPRPCGWNVIVDLDGDKVQLTDNQAYYSKPAAKKMADRWCERLGINLKESLF